MWNGPKVWRRAESRSCFDRGQPYFQPLLLSLGVSASKQLAGALNGESQAMQQSTDVLLVVVHTEVLLDPVLHHGTVPHAGATTAMAASSPDRHDRETANGYAGSAGGR